MEISTVTNNHIARSHIAMRMNVESLDVLTKVTEYDPDKHQVFTCSQVGFDEDSRSFGFGGSGEYGHECLSKMRDCLAKQPDAVLQSMAIKEVLLTSLVVDELKRRCYGTI